jgi:hypothetical protein
MQDNETIKEEIKEYCHNCEKPEDFIESMLIKNCNHFLCKGQTKNFQCSIYTNKTVKKTLTLIKQ